MNSPTISRSNLAAGEADGPAAGSDLRILTPGLSAEEIAAVTAVVSVALAEQRDSAETPAARAQSEWMATRRPLRTAVHPGPGHWGRRPV